MYINAYANDKEGCNVVSCSSLAFNPCWLATNLGVFGSHCEVPKASRRNCKSWVSWCGAIVKMVKVSGGK